jgi:hypothetical protein
MVELEIGKSTTVILDILKALVLMEDSGVFLLYP